MSIKTYLLAGAAAFALTLTACDTATKAPDAGKTEVAASTLPEIDISDAMLAGNPFQADWGGTYGVPPFDLIKDEHYMPAVKMGIVKLRAEIDEIVNNPDAPTFENTIVALDKAGGYLDKVSAVFGNITNTDTNEALRKLESEIYPMLSREYDAISFNPALFERVKTVYAAKDTLGLGEQEARLLELTHRQFIRNGAALSPEVTAQISEINSELSSLTTKFGQNLLASTKAFKIVLTDPADLAGLSPDFAAAIKAEGKDEWTLTLDRSVYETFMTQSENRDLRKQMFDGYRLRSNGGAFDNGPVLIKIAQLRAKSAELMGYKSHAHYQLETRMAKTPQAAEEFLLRVWRPGLEAAKTERADMQAMMGDTAFEGHDWWHYAEKVRQDKYAFDDNVLKPYFELEAVRAGAFDVAERLFEIELTQVPVDGWNPVVTSYDVKDAKTGDHLGLFMMDMYARESKRGGAWMSGYRGTTHYDGEAEIRPIITNNLNLITPAKGEPTLMRFDEVSTLYHEFGHGLHGLLTQIKYSSFSGVDGPRDYTEFPAQIMEHWASQPLVLAEHAKHYQTGDVIPADLVEKMKAAANHGQGFATTEFIAASLLDLRWHMLSSEEAAKITDAYEFERDVLDGYGLLPEIEPRYRSNYFSHIFAGGYSAGYYAYLWSEILDADGFEAFTETGDIFNPEVAARLKKWVYESGGLREADELYRNFRGSDPSIEPLLKGRGFAVDEGGTN